MPKTDPIRTVKEGIDAAKYRRRPSGFRFAISDGIQFLNAEHWDALTSEASLFFHREFLQVLETAGPREIFPRYAVLYRDSRPVAALVVQMLKIDATKLLGEAMEDGEDNVWKKTSKRVRDQALKGLQGKILVCGNLLSWGQHGIVIAPGENAAKVWPGITEALYRIRRAEKLAGQTDYVMVKDLPADDDAGSDALRRFSYRPLETDPDMVLDIPASWQSYDDYLASLNKKYRKSARTIADAVTKAGCRLERLEQLHDDKAALHALYKQVQRRANVRLASLPEDYLPEMCSALGPERFRCVVLRRDEKLLGFVTLLKDGEVGIGYYIGVDYAANDEIPVYLRLLNAVVEEAIDWGCRRVSFGRTALEPKARLGAQPVPMRVWIRHRIPLVNFLVRQLFHAVPHDEPPERQPFKSN